MPAKTGTRKTNQVTFDQKLVLFNWMLSLFEAGSIQDIAKHGLKHPDAEGYDENNVSFFYKNIVARTYPFPELPDHLLLKYDENIFRHTRAINEHREPKIKWKYFQYLCLLFTEIYLDRYFEDPEKLLKDLNDYLSRFNRNLPLGEQVVEFKKQDLNKIAFWQATGSGKTLQMHINIMQYKHYLNLHKREGEMNKIILLTPNEGLSKQHLDEFRLSGIEAELFRKEKTSKLYRIVEVIDIHKLADDMGEKTVAVDAFEDNNLVLVDEGHRGSSGVEWKARRDQICRNGFSFEYSATFGQAIKASKKGTLEQEYAKCILFDYSYKYFYLDGYGKEYSILNLADDSEEDVRKLYLTACLLSYYQQMKVYQENRKPFTPFMIEKPLWIFVGGSVNAVYTRNKRKVSDVADVLLFLADFCDNPAAAIHRLERLLSGKPGLLDTKGREIFANEYLYLIEKRIPPSDLYRDILKLVFNSSSGSGGKIRVENLKGTDGELAVKLGENDPFGLINVGDAGTLKKLLDTFPELIVQERDFSGSLFGEINEESSPINLLVGSKKFIEGWNSWRVSIMGFMNFGRTEGSEIIQLFGRGVRLKGYKYCLKRSTDNNLIQSPKNIEIAETLNIFGVRADYMQKFREYLEEEGLFAGDDLEEIILPVITMDFRKYKLARLKTIKIPKNLNFKKDGKNPTLDLPDEKNNICKNKVILDLYPKIQAAQSNGAVKMGEKEDLHEECLRDEHLEFLDVDRIYFELENYKNEKSLYNLNLPREKIMELLKNHSWYNLYIPQDVMKFDSFEKVRKWEEIAAMLLKKYVDRYYKDRKAQWESKYLKYYELEENDPNFLKQYRIQVEKSKKEIIRKINQIKREIENGCLQDYDLGSYHSIVFNSHLYKPLLCIGDSSVKVSPVSLNPGEKAFVIDLRKHFEANQEYFENKQLYLLRNQVKGRGVGFFEAGNFYPDFIMWLLLGDQQFITFVDPKGLKMLDERFEDPKLSFYIKIKEIQQRLNDPKVFLNSVIVTPTKYDVVKCWGKSKKEFEDRNVLFQFDDRDTYIKKLLDKATLK